MATIGNMPLRLFVAVAIIGFFVLACDWVGDEAVVPVSLTPERTLLPTPLPEPAPTHTPSIALVSSQGITPAPTHPPTPTLTVMQQNRFWEYDVNSALDEIDISNLMPDLSLWGVEGATREIYFGLVCQRDIDRAWEVLHEHLPPLGIPLDVVRVEAIGYMYPQPDPPPTDIFPCVPPEVIDPGTGVSAPGFGGLYIEDDIAYIYLLEPSRELAEMLVLEETSREFIENGEVRALQGLYTWEQLMEWYDLMWGTGWSGGMNIDIISLVPRHNRIELRGHRGDALPDLDIEKIREGLSRIGVPCDAVFLNEDDFVWSRYEDKEKKVDELSKINIVCDASEADEDLPLTHLRADKYTALQLGQWRHRAESALPWVTVSSVRRTESRVFLGVDCEKNVERSLQILHELRIPLDAVRVEAIGYVKPDVHPPEADLFDCYPPEVVDPVTGISRPGFGGLYLESDIAYIYLLEPSQELGEEMVREELGGKEAFERIREVRVLEGQFTWEQLWTWYQLISRGDGLGEGTNIRFAEPVPKENRIKLVSYPDKPLVIERIEGELSRLGIPRQAIIFVDEWE